MIDFKYLSSANEERIYDYLNNLANCKGCLCAKSYIRFLNSSAVSSVDIYIDGNIVASDLELGQMTDFMVIYPSDYNIFVFSTGNTESPILNKAVSINKNSSYTAVIAGEKTDFYIIKETRQEIPAFREAVVTYSNFAPTVGNVDLYLSGKTMIYRDIGYGESIPNVLLFPDEEIFEIKHSGTDETIATTPMIQLYRASYYSLFSILVGSEVKLIITLSGLNFLDLC
jgi:hypothetical protein